MPKGLPPEGRQSYLVDGQRTDFTRFCTAVRITAQQQEHETLQLQPRRYCLLPAVRFPGQFPIPTTPLPPASSLDCDAVIR